MSNELWCIYLAGPDDLVAMPSKAVAEAVARNFNAVWDRYGAERGHNVRAVAHTEPWMHGRGEHAKDIREHFHEYADLVLDEDASRFKPAQPVEAVDQGFAQMIEYHDRMGRCANVHGESAQAAMHETYAGLLRAYLAHPRPTGDAATVDIITQPDGKHQVRVSRDNMTFYAGIPYDHAEHAEFYAEGVRLVIGLPDIHTARTNADLAAYEELQSCSS